MKWIQFCRGCISSKSKQIGYSDGKLEIYDVGERDFKSDEELENFSPNGNPFRTLKHSYSFLENSISGNFPVPWKNQRFRKYLFSQKYLSLTAPDKPAANLAFALSYENPYYVPHPDFNSEFSPISRSDLEHLAENLKIPQKCENDSEDEKFKKPLTKPMTREEEAKVFKSFNYYKKEFLETAREIFESPIERLSAAQIFQLVDSYNEAALFREFLVKVNQPLAMEMPKRIVPKRPCYGLTLRDLITLAKESILRAVEDFDCARGYKFSSYATRAIRVAITRAISAEASFRSNYGVPLGKSSYSKNSCNPQREDTSDELAFLRSVIKNNGIGIKKRDLQILRERFGFDGNGEKTLAKVGKLHHISKERVRQLQDRALEELRLALTEKFYP